MYFCFRNLDELKFIVSGKLQKRFKKTLIHFLHKVSSYRAIICVTQPCFGIASDFTLYKEYNELLCFSFLYKFIFI